jgi:NADPH:quinone reductase-like Zn-dependent oxidoreductase
LKALAFQEHGGLDKLRYQDVADPTIGAGDVLVRVRASALNHLDLFVREGLPGLTLPLPFWTGCDIAGEIAQVGAAVRDVTVGDRVAVNPNLSCGRCEYCLRGEHSMCVKYGILGEHTHGGPAEYVKVEARHVLPLPAAIR